MNRFGDKPETVTLFVIDPLITIIMLILINIVTIISLLRYSTLSGIPGYITDLMILIKARTNIEIHFIIICNFVVFTIFIGCKCLQINSLIH